MRKIKQGLALLLTALMLVGCLPMSVLAAQGDYTAGYRIERTSDANYNGKDVAEFSFLVNADNKPVGNANSIIVAYDTSIFQLLKKEGTASQEVTKDGWSDNIFYPVTVSVYTDPNKGPYTASVYACLSDDGKLGYLALQATLTGTKGTISGQVTLISVYFGLAEGASWDAIPTNAIRLVTPEEREMLNQSAIVVINDGTTDYMYGASDGSDMLAEPKLEAVGYTPVKSAYTGTQASAPTVASKKGGDVTLAENAEISGESVEYGWSTSATVQPTSWQDGVAFNDLDVGTVYFWARVKETADHQAGTAVVSDAVTVYAAPAISYGAVTGTVNSAIAAVTPALTGGSETGTYAITEGTLPTGLSLAENTGVISGTPTVGGSGSVTVTYTDSEGQTATATVNYDISKMAVTTDKLIYDLTEVDYNGSAQPVTVTAKESGMGTITVKYNGSTTEPKDAGTYAITVDVAASELYNGVEGLSLGNYVIAPIQLTAGNLEYTGAAITKTYDGTTDSTVNSGVTVKDGVLKGSDSLTLTVADAEYNSKDVATATKVTITVAAVTEGNYRLAADTKIEAAATITPADYTSNYTEEQSVVVGIGTFTQPTFPGVNGETVKGTLSYTYNGGSKSYDEIVTALKALQKGATATISWSFTATDGNYVDTEKQGTINVTMVDIIFQVGGETATVANALTVKENPVYGDTWEEIVKITGTISASVDKKPVKGTYALDVSGKPNAGANLAYKVIFSATDSTQYQNVEVLSGTVNVAQLEAVLTWSGDTGLVYDGTKKNVTATVSNLVPGDSCDVNVTGGDAVNAGNHTATADSLSNSNYKLPTAKTHAYTIAPKVTNLTVTVSPAEFEYNGSVQRPTTITVKDGETKLTQTDDYTVSIPESKDVATYTVTVTGAGNYEGSTGSATYEITKVSQAAVSIGEIGEKTYGDAAFTITVSGGSGTGAYSLTSSDTSILSLEKGNAAGEWTATIHKAGEVTLTANKAGDDNYEPATEVTQQVEIEAKELEQGWISLPENYAPVYDANPKTPEVTVKDGDKILVKDTDYTVAYTNNTAAGIAKVTVTGKGNYTGEKTINFTIAQAAMIDYTPTVVGEAKVGGVLTAQLDGVASSEYTWKWYYKTDTELGYANIAAADGKASFVVTSDLSNKEIYAEAVADEENYTGTSLSSNHMTVAKQAIAGTVVVKEFTNVAAGTAGTIEVGDTLEATATVTPNVSLTYQWNVDGVAVANANSSTYTVQDADEGKPITVTVTAGSDYEGSVTSAPVEVGKKPVANISGISFEITVDSDEKTITAEIKIGEEIQTGFVIRWLRNGVDTGVTGDIYTVKEADKGADIVAVATVENDETYTGALVSNSQEVDATAPAAPTVTATAGDREVTVSWTVSDNGGAPITGYTVQCGSDPAITLDAATTSYTFTGLTNDTPYTVTVKAINAEGTSTAGSATATPTAPSGGGSIGGGGGVTTYATTVEKTENGSVTVSPKNASKGATVTLTVTPDEGYVLDTITVTDKNGNAIEVTKTSDGKYTFKMPGAPVTVKASFTEETVESNLPFTDVAENAWYYDAVAYVYENGMMTGTNDGTTFSPAMSLSRSMMAQVLYNLEKGTAPATGSFTDVAAGAWYADAVNWAAANGIVGGYGNGKFGPEDSITREQMALILYNYANFKGYDMTATTDLSSFSDDEKVSDWAEYAMKWAVAEGLINGSNNALNPLGTASRAEVAQILANFGENVAK